MKYRTLLPMADNLREIILYQRTPPNESRHQFFSKSVCLNVSKLSRQGSDACSGALIGQHCNMAYFLVHASLP